MSDFPFSFFPLELFSVAKLKRKGLNVLKKYKSKINAPFPKIYEQLFHKFNKNYL